MEYIQLIAGLIILLYSGKFLVKGGVALAGHFKLSTLVIGVTVVSFGTSAPELVVCIRAAIQGHPDIAIYNVVGSNISNIALVLGLTSIILPIKVKGNSVTFDWPIMIFISLLFLLFVFDLKLQNYEGAILFLMLIIFIVWSIRRSKNNIEEIVKPRPIPKFSLLVSILFIVISSIGLAFGSNWLVNGAVNIAHNFGVSDRIISASVIAVGTSVPELTTSIIAALKKQTDISIGNVIGSNIFNIAGILGITSIIKSIKVNPLILQFDIYWLLGISILLFVFIIPLKGGKITRFEAFLFLLFYIIYIYMVINFDIK